jgi:hypothetical protein
VHRTCDNQACRLLQRLVSVCAATGGEQKMRSDMGCSPRAVLEHLPHGFVRGAKLSLLLGKKCKARDAEAEYKTSGPLLKHRTTN